MEPQPKPLAHVAPTSSHRAGLDPAGAVILALPPREPASSRVDELLREAREALGMPIAFVSRFVDGQRVIESVDATCPVPFAPGDSEAAEDTYCQRIIDGVIPQAIPDTQANPVTAALPVTVELDVGSHVGVPIKLHDGSIYGTLCAYSHEARPVDERDSAILSLVARSVAQHLSSELAQTAEQAAVRDRVVHVVENELLRSVYQPIIDVSSGAAVSVEALTRFEGTSTFRPDEWFAHAARVGEAARLEVAAIRCAVDGLGSLPEDVALSVNVSAAVVHDRHFANWLETAPVERLILELTEHEAVGDYVALNLALEAARARGLRLAVDDAGAGYASMRHTLLLRPDLLKLDISLIRDLDTDSDKRALCSAIITFAHSLGARVVAEGVETAGELAAVRRLGVNYVQGYHFAAPTALAEVRFDGYRHVQRRPRPGSKLDAGTATMIREMAHAGASPSTIAARLNQAGEPAPSGVRWHGRAVSQFLTEMAALNNPAAT